MQTSDWALTKTEDGSFTLISEKLGENYHSLHGAYSESMHVYIQNGLLNKIDSKAISILEVGLGTGLNCLLTIENKPVDQTVYYAALEPFPIKAAFIDHLVQAQKNVKLGTNLAAIHMNEWNDKIMLEPTFGLKKLKLTFQEFETQETFDIIYYDAFGAHIQAEMWDENNCQKLYKLLKANGIVITYCAKGSFKRNLKNAGFSVEPLPGPKGKREITRARKLV